jgi:hypothetical protein
VASLRETPSLQSEIPMTKDQEITLINRCRESAELLHGQMLLSDEEIDRINLRLTKKLNIVLSSNL